MSKTISNIVLRLQVLKDSESNYAKMNQIAEIDSGPILMLLESEKCDGTGEPNIEEQFLEWVDEGTKCPYCEGVGYSVCDVCEGKATIF
ncbi:hypothetical protein HHK36_027055 [Tetracentron sinense]|uniref:Uncharacterized protein n=1 Tax=Tetracentron sinense TaxID=13715 RepID=A0A834YKK5_TETSI|nr:hypothetical protein HHK36_027055 [Tetracentron sinense]